MTLSGNEPRRYPELAATLLAGGRSRRMGRNKALLQVEGKTVLQLLANRLSELTDQVFVSAPDPSEYAFLNLVTVRDVYPGHGPLAGLHAALLSTSRRWVLVLACDLPGVSAVLLRQLVDSAEGHDAVIPATRDGLLHPACAVYSRNCLPIVEENLRLNKNRMLCLAEDPRMRVRIWRPPEEACAEIQLFDVNSPTDFTEFLDRSKP